MMKTESDFKQYYEVQLLAYLKEFDKKRKILVNIRLLNIFLFLALFPAAYFILILAQGNTAWVISLAPVLAAMIYLAEPLISCI